MGLGRFDAADQIITVYNLFALILVLAVPGAFGPRSALIGLHLLIFFLGLIHIRHKPLDQDSGLANPLTILRAWFPILLFIVFYSEATLLSHHFIPYNFDAVLESLDQKIFGLNPAQNLALGMPLVLSEFFHAVYFSYYALMIFPAVLVYRKSIPEFRTYLAGLTLLLFVHNLIFILLPAAGPTGYRAELFTQGWLFIPLMNWIYSWGDYAGAAMPSAHVAASLFIFLSLRKYLPRRGVNLLLIWILAIFVSTVYCAYHYGVDVLAGILMGLVFYGIYLKWPWLKFRPPPAGGTPPATDGLSVLSAPDSAN